MNRFSHIAYASFTDKGLVRGNNEDALFALPQDGVFGVSDGMGGGEAGERAAPSRAHVRHGVRVGVRAALR